MVFSVRPFLALGLGVALLVVTSPAWSQEDPSAEDHRQARLEAPAAVYEAVIEALADGVEAAILLADTQGCFPDDSTSSLLGADNVGQAQRECAAKGQRASLLLLDIEALSPAVRIIDRRDLVGQDFYSAVGLEQPALQLSRPGFSNDSTTVVLHGTRYCGHLCGSTHLFTLERRAGNWIVINNAVLGIF